MDLSSAFTDHAWISSIILVYAWILHLPVLYFSVMLCRRVAMGKKKQHGKGSHEKNTIVYCFNYVIN